MARASGVPFKSLLLLLSSLGWIGCTTPTATSLAQTTNGATLPLPRSGDVLQIAPENVEGEALVDVPAAPGQPALRIVTGTVKLDLVAQSVGFILGAPNWAEVVVRFSLTPKAPLRGALLSANGIAMPAAFDAPGFQDYNNRIGFGVKSVNIEQLPNGEVVFFVRVAVRGMMDTKLLRIAYQANLLWTPAGTLPSGQMAVPPAPFPAPVAPPPVPVAPPPK